MKTIPKNSTFTSENVRDLLSFTTREMTDAYLKSFTILPRHPGAQLEFIANLLKIRDKRDQMILDMIEKNQSQDSEIKRKHIERNPPVKPVYDFDQINPISKKNIEIAISIIRSKGKKTATIRQIVDVIRENIPFSFSMKNRNGKFLTMNDYRGQLNRKYLDSKRRLLGKYNSRLVSGQYIFILPSL